MSSYFSRQQVVRKPALASSEGIVASQNRAASEVGAKILAEGGNAVDAAIATSFALGVTEPWMSGPGGGGYMLVALNNKTPKVIDFGMQSPSKLNPDDYPTTKHIGSDLFSWPAVKENRNSSGATSIAIPGHVDGMRVAWETYGSLPWVELLTPAIDLAEKGLIVDWYTQLILASAAKDLVNSPKSKETFFDDSGFTKSSSWTALGQQHCDLTTLAHTLRKISVKGARDFYEGEIAESLIRDMQTSGGCITESDLQNYEAKIYDAKLVEHENGRLFISPRNSGGPMLAKIFNILREHSFNGNTVKADDYSAYIKALTISFLGRIRNISNEKNTKGDSCTTHFNVIDSEGNMVACTQTLLSMFGSRLMLPETGLLMNNGIMWFDPEQGKPNSLGPNKPCLANMSPVIGERNDGFKFALGAAGGRKIIPAVLQLSSFLLDFDMSLNDAFHSPRVDVSGLDQPVVVDDAIAPETIKKLKRLHDIVTAPRTIFPYNFACPSAVGRHHNINFGSTEIMSIWSDAVSEQEFK